MKHAQHDETCDPDDVLGGHAYVCDCHAKHILPKGLNNLIDAIVTERPAGAAATAAVGEAHKEELN